MWIRTCQVKQVRAAMYCFFFKRKTAYELRISDWSSDVCSSDLKPQAAVAPNAYDDPEMWFARPGMENNPSAWRPAADGSETPGTEIPAEKAAGELIPPAKAAQTAAEAPFDKGDAAVFFVHPTRTEERRVGNACVSTGRSRW